MSAEETARRCGYATKWGYSRYEQTSHGRSPMPVELIRRLIPIWVGKGAISVTRDELIALAGPGFHGADFGPSEAQGAMPMAMAKDEKISEAPAKEPAYFTAEEVKAFDAVVAARQTADPVQRWELVQEAVRQSLLSLGCEFALADRAALRVLRRLVEAGLL